ncbi:hypothetical protein ABE137_12655 [Brevibacillus laterosporus]|uniref:hypothetical protein n=1 Tax=Brevibacillus laterosporus TaxID=1465 RepID=UPI0006BC9431|nr:hypothetical protein [Brevibacillus laterosporus]YP_009194073.1 putative structural protein [Brevibacillus phage Sundance]ALA47839.1 putative structural protein [Brevibacillus phage Sundance]MCR8994645.1 hypothetical protein [Brevibacillus laterosporus]
MHDIAKLAIDVYKNQGDVTKFSRNEAMEVLRRELVEANGGSDKLTPKSFRNNPQLFAILEEALDILIEEGLKGQFDTFVETIVVDHGDTKVFTVEENRLFDVAIISDGNGDLRRDRLDTGELTIKTSIMGVAVYEELARLLAGRQDFAKLVENVARSYDNKIQNLIYDAVYNSYNQLGSTYAVSGSFTEQKLDELIAHVEASTGMEAMILGTKAALAKINYGTASEKSKQEKNDFGFYGNFHGTPMMVIKQAHKVGSTEFAIDNSFLMVVPKTPDKMVKLVLEGDSMIIEGDGSNRKDMQREYTFIKKAGIAVLSSAKYGIYRLT